MTENQPKQKKKYEIAFLLKEENNSIISPILKKRGFDILAENPLVKIRLAYPVKKESYAYFGCCHFEGEPGAIKELRADLKLNLEILRYLIITPPFVKEFSRKFAPEKEKSEKKVSLSSESILTNEALEKKIEEILK